jgi:tetratricopeptide (TPR) repeat protein
MTHRIARMSSPKPLSFAALVSALALWPAACGAPSEVAPLPVAPVVTPDAPALIEVDRLGWISEVVIEPSVFEELVGEDREGWVQLHANRYGAAVDAFRSPVGRARAEYQLALLHDDLARLAGLANESYFTEWEARSKLPPNSVAAVVASLASFCSDSGSLVGWASRTQKDVPGYDLAQAIARGRAPWDVESVDVFGRRMHLHRRVRVAGEAEALVAASTQPLVVERGDGADRSFYDPCLHLTLAQHWITRAGNSLGATGAGAMVTFHNHGLAGRLFAPWLSPGDLVAEQRAGSDFRVLGARTPSLRKLGVGTNPHAGDDVSSAVAEVASLRQGLEGWSTWLKESGQADGLALAQDLRLLPVFSQRWLITRARAALLEDRPEQAETYLNAALNPEDPSVGPSNPPELYALIAEARLRQGRAREALNALQELVRLHPEAIGVREAVANLVALRSMGRGADSKEQG